MRRSASIAVFCVVLAMVGWSLAGCGKQEGMVEGIVTRADDGQPVDSALVTVFELHGLDQSSSMAIFQKGSIVLIDNTDRNGAYSIPLEVGNYVIEIQADGLETASSLVQVKGGKPIIVDFSLTPPSP